MINNQANLFLIFTFNGILIGLLFDFFRILRKILKTNNFFTYIEDIIFWILTGVIILYSIYYFNNGDIRFFIFLGILLGFLLYILTVSKYIISFFVYISNFISKILYQIIKLLFFPLKIVSKLFLKPINFIIFNVRKIGNKLLKTTKRLKNSKFFSKFNEIQKNKKDFVKKRRNI